MHSERPKDTKIRSYTDADVQNRSALTNDNDADHWPPATIHSLLAAIDIEIWQFAIFAISFYFLAEANASRIVASIFE